MKHLLKKLITWKLKILTKITLWRHKPVIIGVVGSTLKTETKEEIKKALSRKFDVRANPRSYNTEIGLPLAVLYLPSGESSLWRWFKVIWKGLGVALFSRKFPEILILELGAIFPGEMDYLLTIIKLRYLVTTNVSLGFEASPEELGVRAKEIEKAIKAVPKDGVVILNTDDPWLLEMKDEVKAKVITFGKKDAKEDYPHLAAETLVKELEKRK
jgi:UDP-N-acetylmuramoyl-tripeptide--D-alanyl-D-alanine ligase